MPTNKPIGDGIMTMTRLRLAAAFTLLLFAAACTAPLYKVNSKPYGWGPAKGVTMAQVQSTVEETAKHEGWTLSNVKTGSFTAERQWDADKHNIVVDVVYDLQKFSIIYKDSKQMGYSGSSIHHTYNDMVQRLEDHIKTNVSKLTP
jgi:hypothetical protein